METNGSQSSPGPAPVRLRRGRIHAVGLVDEAANGWNWLAIQKSKLQKGTNMDVAGNAAGDAAASAGAATAATKALQLPPNTKNAVMETITSAQEGLATILTAMSDAEEGEGAPMPEELISAIDQIGMQLCAFAEQHSATANAATNVQMNADEASIANALSEGAPEIAKAVSKALMGGGNSVKKAALKVAPAQMVMLMKELIEEFAARAQKWGPLFAGEAVAPAAAPVAPATKDARATLKSVASNASARVAKSLGEQPTNATGATNTTTAPAITDMAAVLKALEALPGLQAKLVKLEKSLVGGEIDALDDASTGGDGDGLKYEYGENISARVRKSLAKKNKASSVDDDDDDINLDD